RARGASDRCVAGSESNQTSDRSRPTSTRRTDRAEVGQQDRQIAQVNETIAIDVAIVAPSGATEVRQQDCKILDVDLAVIVQVTPARDTWVDHAILAARYEVARRIRRRVREVLVDVSERTRRIRREPVVRQTWVV